MRSNDATPHAGENERAAGSQIPTSLKMQVTRNEAKFFQYLKDFQQTTLCPTKKDIRIAGGWVRDKLLGRSSNDIDVALEDCSGETFARGLQTWFYRNPEIGRVEMVVVRANPEASKHLETAIVRLPFLELSVDFVNLRTETYSQDSRIPTMEFGTPLDDAQRRDLTLNALFYNVTRGEIEDYTRQGLEDLRTLTLRTPLAPRATFLDDPLRVIRTARFMAKLPGSKCVEELVEAARSKEVHQALKNKITRDRLRQEIAKMFEYSNAMVGLKVLYDWNLMDIILMVDPLFHTRATLVEDDMWTLAVPRQENCAADLTASWVHGAAILCGVFQLLANTVAVTEETSAAIESSEPISEEVELTNTCVFWMEDKFRTFEVQGALCFATLLWRHQGWFTKDKRNSTTAAECAIGNLKAKALWNQISTIFSLVRDLRLMCQDATRVTLAAGGELLRQTGAARWWELALLIASASIVYEEIPQESRPTDLWSLDLIAACVVHCARVRRKLLGDFKLAGVWDAAPLLSGNDLQRVLPNLGRGPKFGFVMKQQMKWLIDNWRPTAAARTELRPQLEKYLREIFRECC